MGSTAHHYIVHIPGLGLGLPIPRFVYYYLGVGKSLDIRLDFSSYEMGSLLRLAELIPGIVILAGIWAKANCFAYNSINKITPVIVGFSFLSCFFLIGRYITRNLAINLAIILFSRGP